IDEHLIVYLERPDQMILIVERDQDIFDLILQVQRCDRAPLCTNDFRIARGCELEVETSATFECKDHPGAAIDNTGTNKAGQLGQGTKIYRHDTPNLRMKGSGVCRASGEGQRGRVMWNYPPRLGL